jgi:membrane fusion protein (multidrug efflux system)
VKLSLLLLIVLAGACGKESAAPPQQSAPPPAAEVGVVTVAPTTVTLTRELPGRTSAFRVAEVRARVNGIVRKRLFAEGSDVKAGQTLFEIEPAPYEAALESARAQQLRAEATVESARAQAERYTKLIETNAVSRQEYEDAQARLKTATADVAAAKAAVKTAEINLGYTKVVSPIAGRIGRSEVTEGAYAQAGAATLLATVQQLDPVYVDMTWSSAEMLRLRRKIESGEVKTVDGKASVTVVLEDGREHGQLGTLEFADVTVDPGTGSISLRAIVPNPKRELLPGMFVRARIAEGVKSDALLVPQRAVTRDQNGRPLALVVDAAGKVERRQLVTDRAIGDAWLVTEGLRPGERVVVEGMQRIRPGASVKPVPAGAPAPQRAGSAGSAGSAAQRAGR